MDGNSMFGLDRPVVVQQLHNLVDTEFTDLIRPPEQRSRRQRKTNPRFSQSQFRARAITEKVSEEKRTEDNTEPSVGFLSDFTILLEWLQTKENLK